MNQDANLQDICAQQIQHWLDNGQSLSEITAAELHQATELPYTQCLEALRNFRPANETALPTSSSIPPPPAALQEIFRQSQQQIWQTLWQEQQLALDQLQQTFSHEKKQLLQTADERLAMIEKLEQTLSEKDAGIAAQQNKFQEQLSLIQELEQQNLELSRERDELSRRLDQLERQLDEKVRDIAQLEQTLQETHEEARQQAEKSRTEIQEVEQLVAERSHYTKSQEQEVIRLQQQLADAEKAYAKLELQLSSERADNAWSRDLSTEQAREISQLSQQLKAYEQEISLLKSQLKAADQKASQHQEELRKEQQMLNQALTLSDEQAKEISELSRKLHAAEQEYLRVTNLYHEAKKQGGQLQKELKGMLGR